MIVREDDISLYGFDDRDSLLICKKPDISRTAVKIALKAGEELPGAALGRTVSVIIK